MIAMPMPHATSNVNNPRRTSFGFLVVSNFISGDLRISKTPGGGRVLTRKAAIGTLVSNWQLALAFLISDFLTYDLALEYHRSWTFNQKSSIPCVIQAVCGASHFFDD